MNIKIILIIFFLVIIVLVIWFFQVPKGQYVDVAFTNLNPIYHGKFICLYGNYSVGFEHSGFGSLVWAERRDQFGDFIFPTLESHGRLFNDYGNTIACGIIKYSFIGGFGHFNSYPYLLSVDVITDAAGESPYTNIIENSNDCKKIPGSKRKDICYWKFGIDEQNIQLCEEINNKVIKNTCYWHIAELSKNPAFCDKIDMIINMSYVGGRNDLSMSDVCIVNSVSREHSICEKISDSDLKDGCLSKVAYETSNPEICARIGREEGKVNIRGECYGDLAYKLNDISICEQLDEWDRDVCYFYYAGITKKYEYCDKIVRESMRENCPRYGKTLNK